jgi:hypothetical protein
LTVVHIPQSAPAMTDDVSIEAWLTSQLGAADSGFPADDPQNLYVVFYPATTTITLSGVAVSCQTYGGYHSQFAFDGGARPYAVIPDCPGFSPGMTDDQTLTSTASHEVLEAITDPHPKTMPGYYSVDSLHLAWVVALGGGELGDLCAQFNSSFVTLPGFPYEVQLYWSNLASAASHDPCQPIAPGAYFNAVPVMVDIITLRGQQTQGVLIPHGGMKTIDVDLYSDGPVDDWQLSATDLANGANLDFALSQPSGNNGDAVQLTITFKKMTAGGATFAVVSKNAQQLTHYYLGYVNSQ